MILLVSSSSSVNRWVSVCVGVDVDVCGVCGVGVWGVWGVQGVWGDEVNTWKKITP